MLIPIVRTHNIKKYFLSKVKVLDGVNLVAKENQVTTILGSSGSGKSTLLRCLNLLEIPDEGDIFINGEKILLAAKKNKRVIKNFKQIQKMRTMMPMIFQHFNLWSHLNVSENIMHAPLKVLKLPYKQVAEIAMECLQKVGLERYSNYFPSQLSGGQKQRVAIARAMTMRPKIILLDEPTSALDPEMVNEVLIVLQNLTEDKCSMILVTHEINFAKDISDKIIFLDKGVIEEEGGREILSNPQSKRLQDFLQYAHFD